jgi:hypothetical protein
MNTPKIKFKPRITRKYIHKGGASTERTSTEGISTEKNSTTSTTYVVFVKENDTGITAETGNILELNDTTDIETLTKKIKPDTKAVGNLYVEPFYIVENNEANAIARGEGIASGNLRPSVEGSAIANARSSGEGIAIANASAESNASVKGIASGSASGEGIAIANASAESNASVKGIASGSASGEGIAIANASAERNARAEGIAIANASAERNASKKDNSSGKSISSGQGNEGVPKSVTDNEGSDNETRFGKKNRLGNNNDFIPPGKLSRRLNNRRSGKNIPRLLHKSRRRNSGSTRYEPEPPSSKPINKSK